MKKIAYGKQTIDESDIKSVIDVLKTDYLTTGPKVKEFEELFAKYVGSKYAVAVSSGTAALHVACLAAGLKEGDELITTPISFAASSNCALYCKAHPVFADIKNDNGLIDHEEIRKKITKKTKIILPVHYTGLPCDMKDIYETAKKNNIVIIEDACHALGTKYKDSKIGDCKYSDMCAFSFHPVKHITTGEGGMITTNSEVYYKKLIILRNHGITRDKKELYKKNEGDWHYEMQELGYNYRLTDIQCALGISQLKKADKFINRRVEIARKYDEAFRNDKDIQIIRFTKEKFNPYHLYIILAESCQKRKELFNYLKDNGIFCQVHYIPIYLHPYYQKLGYKKGLCPNAERFYERIISIPIYPSLSEDEQEFVIKNIKQFFKS